MRPTLPAVLPALCLCLLLSVPAAADPLRDTRTGPGGPAPSSWLGEAAHLRLVGRVGAFTFDFDLDAEALAAAHKFEAKREDLEDGGGFRYVDFEWASEAVLDGIAKSLEFEFENRDFAAEPVGADYALQFEEFP
jgi:hypothetical protein